MRDQNSMHGGAGAIIWPDHPGGAARVARLSPDRRARCGEIIGESTASVSCWLLRMHRNFDESMMPTHTRTSSDEEVAIQLGARESSFRSMRVPSWGVGECDA